MAREKTAVIIPEIDGTGKSQNGVYSFQRLWMLFAAGKKVAND
ncbi:MAG TPA: hypothetical protein VJT54_12495 [Verrucomicrobiae bacterium]|nr:hypothetical protein [Verrucomicrobiae bacterium]